MADLTPVYYIAGTLASLAGVAGGFRSYYNRQRSRWTDEGARATRQANAMDANTRAARENTEAIREQTRKLDQFAHETRLELRNHDTRIGRLEDMADSGVRGSYPHASRRGLPARRSGDEKQEETS